MSAQLGTYFSDPIHHPYHMDGGRTAVVLVHGFPGTPAETRAVAERLRNAGSTCLGVLLPGFGPQIDRIFEYSLEDWIDASMRAVEKMRADHERVFLLGYSFGGAVAIHAAARLQLDGLILAAPFWRIGGPRERLIWGVTRRIFTTLQPFRSLDLSRPEFASGLARMLPGVDPTQVEVRKKIKDIRVPVGFLEEVISTGATAMNLVPQLRTKTLLLQGHQDTVITPAATRELAKAFTENLDYFEAEAGHALLEPSSTAFEAVCEMIIQFISRIE